MEQSRGIIALFGSGETSPNGRKVYEWLFSQLALPIRVAILETPAGFQPNSAIVAQKIADFLKVRLQNYRPEVSVVAARQRGTLLSPDNPDTLSPMLSANALFMGPGSPSYAVRQLKGSLAWEYLQAKQRVGSGLILASAATVAIGTLCLPVYEIYKAGEDLHWREGLDLFAPYGLSLTFIPHWDNAEGGAELDTSRCFMGQARFARLLELLPQDTTIVGIDEHTALVMDLNAGMCRVMGRGGVTIVRGGGETRHPSGRAFGIEQLGAFHHDPGPTSISPQVWEHVLASGDAPSPEPGPAPEVLALAEERQVARARSDWARADAVRQRIADLGWRVRDTPDGPILEP